MPVVFHKTFKFISDYYENELYIFPTPLYGATGSVFPKAGALLSQSPQVGSAGLMALGLIP